MVFGAAGTGKTTLGRELSARLGIRHLDLDDFFWVWDSEVTPFTEFRPKDEYIAELQAEISKHPRFVMSGTMGSIRGLFNPLFGLAVFVTVPTAIRIERLRAREDEMFGERIRKGGDMFEQSKQFFDEAARYDMGELPMVCLKQHEQWASELCCPVLRINGVKPVAQNAALIAERYLQLAE